jgi:hypothetical protein
MFKRFVGVIVVALAVIAGPVGSAPAPAKAMLHGSIHGKYAHPQGVDGPIVYLLQGTGTVKPLGMVNANGSIIIGVSIGGGAGPNSLSISLGNARGTVTLTLKAAGPTFPASFQYIVSNATGAFAGLKGKTGMASYKMIPATLSTGTFTLTLS